MGAVWLGEPMMVSNSEIQMWKSCPRQWYVNYYLQLGLPKPAGEVGPRALGTKIHIALEQKYEEGQDPIAIVNEIYADEIRMFEESEEYSDAAVKKLQSEKELANAMLTGYLDWVEEEGIDAGLTHISSEEVIIAPSGIPGVSLRGRIDARFERDADGAVLFRDYKSVPEMTTPTRLLPLDEQFRTYGLLEYLKALDEAGDEAVPVRTDGGMYTMLRKVKRTKAAKPPFYGQITVQFNKAVLRSTWIRVHKVIEEIVEARQALDAGSDHQYVCRPRPSRDCTWKCDHFHLCPMMDDGSNYEGLMREYYVPVDPNERYLEEEEQKGDI